jgi:hypothetical protein
MASYYYSKKKEILFDERIYFKRKYYIITDLQGVVDLLIVVVVLLSHFYPKQNFIHISKGETADFRLQEFKILRETPTRQTSDFHKTSKDLIRLQNIYET